MIRAMALAACLWATPVLAQTIESRIDLSVLNWGTVTAEPVDTDGDPATPEYLVERTTFDTYAGTHDLRVVAVRDGAICPSAWFHVRTLPGEPIRVTRHDRRDRIVVPGRAYGVFGAMPLTIVRLDTPTCP